MSVFSAYAEQRVREFEAKWGPLPTLCQGGKCSKVEHLGEGYLHDAADDGPYDVDRLKYCGRCHGWMDR